MSVWGAYSFICVSPGLPVCRPVVWACELEYIDYPVPPLDSPGVWPFPVDARRESSFLPVKDQVS